MKNNLVFVCNRSFLVIIIFLSLSVFFFSCSKSNSSTPATDVYMAGQYSNTGTGEIAAIYWKNGEPVKLTSSPDFAFANGIAVSGSDVYVSGNFNSTAVYWKNKTPVQINQGKNASVYGIAVSGTDVYLAGAIFTPIAKATYWKNGVAVTLDNNLSYANAITVVGSDVVVAGTVGSNAVYWINGIPRILTTDGTATCVAVYDTSVYVGGTKKYAGGKYAATYWKNGVAVPLGDTTGTSSVTNITVVNNTVYTSGVVGNPGYWINNNFFFLPQGAVPTNCFIAVKGSDIYLATNQLNSNGTTGPIYYKNGQQAPLPAMNDAGVNTTAAAITITR